MADGLESVVDGLESVECAHWPDGAHGACDRVKGRVLVYENGPHHRDTTVLMVVATDLGNDPSYGIGPCHGTHPGANNTGGLLPHAMTRWSTCLMSLMT